MSNHHIAEFRQAMAAAIETYRPQASTIHIELPGENYEPFPLSVGSPVWWKSEPVSHGRMVRFKANGPAQIGLHYHEVPESITCADGVLFYTLGGIPRALIRGEAITAQPHEIHSAEFRAPGEALAHWTDLEGNILEISFFS